MSQPILNSFGLSVTAKKVVTAKTVQELYQYWTEAKRNNDPIMILGYGSNTLFTTDFAGTVIYNRIIGIVTNETECDYLLRVGAGTVWHELVEQTMNAGQYGLENLALIPGSVGSAAIQNIGAYGVEFKKFVDYVELLELETGEIITIHDGNYGYRDSVFKHKYFHDYAIIYVGLKLSKTWQPCLTYGDLKKMDANKQTAKDIFYAVCNIRKKKIPDPAIIGNCGSFFKNPVVDASIAIKISNTAPDLPCYAQLNGDIKLAAGWLIEKCGLKGHQIGGAAVHKNQALVIINKHDAVSDDIVKLACVVRQKVAKQFGVYLEPEVRFIGENSEIDSTKLLNDLALKDRPYEM